MSELDLEAFLPYRLSVMADRVSRSLSHVYARRFGLSIPEWRIVANLGRMGALGAGDLAARSSLDKPKLTRALQRLEARGLVERTAVDADRRRAVLALTADGRRIFRAIGPVALAWEAELLAVLSERERTALAATFDRLAKRLDEMDTKP